MTTSTILYSIDTWFLRRQRLNEYAILTLTGYQQHYAMHGRYIARHQNYIDKMEFPFDVT